MVNTATITETFNREDHLYTSSYAWQDFRSNVLSEDTAALVKDGAEAVAIAESCPFLILCTEDEIYELIHPCFEELDPNAITEVAKSIVTVAESEDGKAQISDFLTNFNDEKLVEAINTSIADGITISEQLDNLLIEGPEFDFGSADDLGSDDLEDDDDTEGIENAQDDDDMDDDDDMGDDEEDMDGETVTLEVDIDDLRKKLSSILNVVGDEIEDNEEFEDLRDQIEDEDSELDGDTIKTTLEVISDYFDAIGKNSDREKEKGDIENREGENLDDMNNLDPDTDDGEGGATDFGGDDDDEDLNLGQ